MTVTLSSYYSAYSQFLISKNINWMSMHLGQFVYSVEASVWDGYQQMPGVLGLTSKYMFFQFKDFLKSHINLQIPLDEIKEVDEFLIYELARGGLRILNKNGHFDLFVLEDVSFFKEKVLKELSKLND